MATGYTIQVGYLSGYSFNGGNDAAWNILKSVAASIAESAKDIHYEAIKYGSPDYDYDGDFSLMDVCNTFALPVKDGGVMIINDTERYIHMMASGNRTLKEHSRRAFIRLVMSAMHRQGIDINVNVA